MYYIIPSLNKYMGFPGGLDVKEAACKAGDLDSVSASGRSPGMRRDWQTIPVFLPGEFHGQGSPAGYLVHGVTKSWTRLNN